MTSIPLPSSARLPIRSLSRPSAVAVGAPSVPRGSTRSALALALSILLTLAALVAVVGAEDPVARNRAMPQVPLATPFAFGAAGDFAFGMEGQSVMTAMGSAGPAFVLALGDLSYGEATEAEWCGFFESKVGDGKVLLIAGNHDAHGSGDGDITSFREYCNFGIDARMTGDYGMQFHFDYPRADPLVRFILTGCGTLSDGEGEWACAAAGDPHYDFVANAIDEARGADIPWVIVGMHKPCISNGGKDCDIGEALMDLLLWKRVDLVLQGHEHAYLRTKRLVCADDDAFRAECVAKDGEWGQVINIVGTGGRGGEDLGGQADEPYFDVWDGNTSGFLKVDVSATALDAQFVPVVGTFTDAYQIRKTAGPPGFTLSASPASLTLAPGQPGFVTVQTTATSGFRETVQLQVSAPSAVTGSCTPSSLPPGETATCTLSGQTPGPYSVTITGTSGSIVQSQDVTVTIAPSPAGPDTTAPLIAIASPSDRAILRSRTVTVTGSASDNAAVQRVDLSADGGNWTQATGTNPWSGTVTVEGGERRIFARATDGSGNKATATILVFVDLTSQTPSGFLDPWWPTFASFGVIAVVAALAIGIAVRSARRRRGSGRGPSRPETSRRHREDGPSRRR